VLVCSVLLAAPALAQEERKECLPLSALEAAKLRSIRVASVIPQAEVQAEAVPVQGTHIQVPLVGFFPAVIASVAVTMAAQSAAESQAQNRLAAAHALLPPLLETTRDFDVRQQFWSRLQSTLGDDARFRVLDIATLAEAPVEAARPAAGEAADAVLELRTHYALTPDLRSFGMTTRARLLAREDNRELYGCTLYFTTPPASDGENEAAVAAWAAQGAALYRAAAMMGVEQTIKMLRMDLTGADAPRPAGEEVHVHETRNSLGGMLRVPVPASLVERDGAVLIARDAKGFMRAAFEGALFTPPEESLAAAASAPAPTPRLAGPVTLEDLVGLMQDQPAGPAAPPPPRPGGRVSLDDLGDLLRE
jgi:hypothetical protein